MAKITKLTPKQEQEMFAVRERALETGFRTGDVNKRTTETVIGEFYRRLGEKTPYFWYVDSPLMAMLVISLLKNDNISANLRANLHDNISDNIHDNISANISANLHDNIHENIRANIHTNLRDNLQANIQANLRANIHANIRANIHENLRTNISANLRANLRDNLHDNIGYQYTYFWGSVDVFWQAYLRFCTNLTGSVDPEMLGLLSLWEKLSEACFWWWPFEGLCVVSQRPSEIHLEPSSQPGIQRLHHAEKQALSFRDGYGLYVWHGVSVPKNVIVAPEKLTKERILGEENTEVRRAMIERIGYPRFFEMVKPRTVATREYRWRSGPKVITEKDGVIFVKERKTAPFLERSFNEKIYEIDDQPEPIRVLHVMDRTTEREYMLGIPPTISDCLEAKAWTKKLTMGQMREVEEAGMET